MRLPAWVGIEQGSSAIAGVLLITTPSLQPQQPFLKNRPEFHKHSSVLSEGAPPDLITRLTEESPQGALGTVSDCIRIICGLLLDELIRNSDYGFDKGFLA